ncbi:MAG: M20/M25/M40 family metallo-hydrolase [Candidatus Thermoplasmatota archaeon]|nr:M20/M25/M40 family metallo-hydrolase [Candidatus Thermoplasmatota archaeon]
MSARRFGWIIVITILLCSTSAVSADSENNSPNDLLEDVSENNIREYIQTLQSFGTRYSFSNNSTLAAKWLFEVMNGFGLWVEYDEFVYNNVTLRNVIGTLNGSSAQTFILSAHYDTINLFDEVKSPSNPNAPAPGANDDASGIAVVLECARVLASAKYNLNASIQFVAFCGEEQGMKGSEHYAERLVSENKTLIGMINLDMVGYPHNSNLTLTYNYDSDWLASAIEQVCLESRIGLSIRKYLDAQAVCDQAPFWKRGTPAVLVSEDYYRNLWNFSYPYLHSANDTSDKLNFSFIAEVARLCTFAVLQISSLHELELKNIELSTLEPYHKETICVSITVRNYGAATNASLKIYDYSRSTTKLIYYENISVDAYTIKTLSFNYTFLTPGRHLICAVIENSTYAELNIYNNIGYRIIECRAAEKISTTLSLLLWLLLFGALAVILHFFVRI